MARHGIKWMDSDLHLCEPVDLWSGYIDPAFKDRIPKWRGDLSKQHPLRTNPGFSMEAMESFPREGDGFSVLTSVSEKKWPAYERYAQGGHVGPLSQLEAMDAEGIDLAPLFPTFGAVGMRDEGIDEELCFALARAYNDWLANFTKANPDRLKHVAQIPLGDPEQAVQEMRRAKNELGSIGIIPGSSKRQIRLDDPVYEPIWAEAEALELTLAFHGDRQVHLIDRYRDNLAFSHMTGRPIEHALAFMELLCAGVLERHPKLRMAFLEAGCGWVPYWLFRLEEEVERFKDASPELAANVQGTPREYFQRQCFVSVEPEEWTLKSFIDTVGDDQLVFSSDFPHMDSSFPHAGDQFRAMEGVSRRSKEKILWDNCRKLYHLD